MARRPEPDETPFTETELKEMRRNLALLSGPHVEEEYRSAHRDCAIERKPSAKAIQRFVTLWKILRKWNWR